MKLSQRQLNDLKKILQADYGVKKVEDEFLQDLAGVLTHMAYIAHKSYFKASSRRGDM